MQEKVEKFIKYILSLLLAAVLLYFSFRGIKWADFVEVLRQCKWIFVVLSALAGLSAYIIRILRWRLLLNPSDPGVKRLLCYDGFAIGKMADFLLPHVGEFVRCGIVSKGSKASYDKTLGTVVLERSWDILSLFVILLILLAVKWSDFGVFFTEKIWDPISGRFSIWAAVVLVAVAVAATVAILLSKKVKDFMKGIWAGVADSLKMPHKWLFLIYTAILWVMFLMMSMTIIWALPENFGLGLSDGLFIMLVGSLAGLVPVPGGFGAFHYLVALALQTLYGIPFETGIVFATLSHETQAVMTLITGGAAYFNRVILRNRMGSI